MLFSSLARGLEVLKKILHNMSINWLCILSVTNKVHQLSGFQNRVELLTMHNYTCILLCSSYPRKRGALPRELDVLQKIVHTLAVHPRTKYN